MIKPGIFRFQSFCAWVSLTAVLTSCGYSPSNEKAVAPVPTPTASTAASTAPTPPAGQIAEIAQKPVSVRTGGATEEIPANEGMALQVGDTIRTQKDGKVQVELNNGLAFRVGGNSTITLQPNNRLSLTEGEMITWVQPGKQVPAEIVTPAGVAGIRGTTVYVNIPQDPKEGVLFFAWEGKVAVRLPGKTEELLLSTGEEVTIPEGAKNWSKILSSKQQINREDWRKLRTCIKQPTLPDCTQRPRVRLFRNFKQNLPTLPKIDQALPEPASSSLQGESQKTK